LTIKHYIGNSTLYWEFYIKLAIQHKTKLCKTAVYVVLASEYWQCTFKAVFFIAKLDQIKYIARPL